MKDELGESMKGNIKSWLVSTRLCRWSCMRVANIFRKRSQKVIYLYTKLNPTCIRVVSINSLLYFLRYKKYIYNNNTISLFNIMYRTAARWGESQKFTLLKLVCLSLSLSLCPFPGRQCLWPFPLLGSLKKYEPFVFTRLFTFCSVPVKVVHLKGFELLLPRCALLGVR